MLEVILCSPFLYLLGWVICALITAHYWISKEAYPSAVDYIEGGVWGLLGGFVWPVFLVGFIIGKLVGGKHE